MSDTDKQEKPRRKLREGFVVSDKMDKTIVVETSHVRQHPLYKKRLERRKKLKAHDEDESATHGDRVLIEETRRRAADKCWRLVEILERSPDFAGSELEESITGEGDTDDTI